MHRWKFHAVGTLCTLAVIQFAAPLSAADPTPFPGTKPLVTAKDADITSDLVAGVDRFLLKQLAASVDRRSAHWKRNFESATAYEQSVLPNRKRLADILGTRDKRRVVKDVELLATTSRPALVGRGENYKVYAVRWPTIRDVHGEGLLLVPNQLPPRAHIVAIPDADQTPEMIAGLEGELPAERQYARRLAASGCRVLVPALVGRGLKKRNNRALLTSREFVYRSAFELGRHVIGYELHKVLAGVDWFSSTPKYNDPRIGVVGWGEGGLLALYAGALDTRIDVVGVSGYFNSRQDIWQEPLDRNVFGLLEQFGDAEIASLIAPRALVVDAALGPELQLPSSGGAPARLKTPALAAVKAEFARAEKLVARLLGKTPWHLNVSGTDGRGSPLNDAALTAVLQSLDERLKLSSDAKPPQRLVPGFDSTGRARRQLDELDRHNQWALRESPFVRKQFMNKLNYRSVQDYEESVKWYREHFRNEVIGHFDQPLLQPNVRTRKVYDKPEWTGYEVVMDVFPDVIAFGVLLMPKDIKPGERRPVVVCQHGLEGRPRDVIEGNHRAYHDYAAELAKRGYITFAPQNLYIFRDRFRTLQRKANPLKKTLFSVIVPQHQQITDWLASLPQVDSKRIAFYGLSYGGKSAMRIPPLVSNYCLSICSADFNEWVRKNASTRHNFSYVWTGEYEIFEWDLGSTFNYAEMAALVCPRPFMVERGHFDGVGVDEWVAYEFAKVRHLYAAKLFIPERTEIEWFYGQYKGVHTINGKATFDFLHRHLSWPKSQ